MLKLLKDGIVLKNSFSNVFNGTDPFSPTAKDTMNVRIVLYPTYGYHLAEKQYNALVLGKLLSNEPIAISEVEYYPQDPFIAGKHWICNDITYEEYLGIPLVLENAIYSTKGTWGIIISHEDHAVLACKKSIWDSFKTHYPLWEKDYELFNLLWSNHKDRQEWLSDFLKHLSNPG